MGLNLRLVWADSLKAWLMVLVVLGHSIQLVLGNDCFNNHLWNIIYSFHMPAFMAVSGYFAYSSKAKTVGLDLFLRRVRQLLVPYLIWSLIVFLVSGDYSISKLCQMFTHPDVYFWFLWVLFWINIIFIFSQCLSKALHHDVLVINILVCASLLALMVLLDIRVFGFQFIAYYYVIYIIGYIIHRFSLISYFKFLHIVFLLVLWFVLAWFWKMHELPEWIPNIPLVPTTIVQYAYRGFTALLAVLLLFAVAPKLLNSTNEFNCFVKKMGELSLGLYVCHLLYGGYVYKILDSYLALSDSLIIVLHFVICIVTVVPIVQLLARFNITSRYLLGKC